MNALDFANVLKITKRPTPLTKEFENAYRSNGSKYGQEKNRWWDNSTKEQKEHLICWFSRRFFDNSTKKCIENSYGKRCERCYFKEIDKDIIVSKSKERGAKDVFNRMGKPEMFICIAESLQILDEPELQKYIDETKDAMDRGKSWTTIRKQYIKWEDVESKILKGGKSYDRKS